ncbi:hypothetical protein ACHAWO_012065 [Cyclotella atomus]|uniref:Importin subunit alpha n=1 Tax=Cyclotella atomus TaxID=382360 RepID=A0ABD3NFU9_9STRA
MAEEAPPDQAQTPQDSLRELNRLLESALRMGGDDTAKNTTNSGSNGSGDAKNEESEEPQQQQQGGEWRLDTARRLGGLLSSELHALQDELDADPTLDYSSNPLLPALARQCRYWIPLLLSWIRQDTTDDDDDAFESSLSLKHRRRRHHSSYSIGRKYVQIESLRALNLLHEWMARCEETEQTITPAPNNKKGTPNACTPSHSLSSPTQKLLLRHPDAVPIVISLLSSPDKSVMEQSAWILGSIASGGLETMSPPSLTCVASAAASAMRSGSENVSVAIGNTNTNTTEEEEKEMNGGKNNKQPSTLTARDAILAAGTMPALLECLDANPDNIELHRVGVWCLSSLIEGRYSTTGGGSGNNPSEKRYNGEEIDIISLLPTLKRLLDMEDWEVLTFACWTLSHVCDGPASNINAVLYSDTPTKKKSTGFFDPDLGLVPRLIELLLHPYPKVVKPALRTIGNVVCAECSDTQNASIPDYTEVILDLNAVPYLRDLVCHENREIQKEACWTLSNIAAGTISQIQAVIDSGVIPPLVELVSDPNTDKEVRSEACWVVLNATSCGSDEQIETLVEEGCVNVLGVLLAEPSMIMMSMEGLERVLQTEEAKDATDLRANNGTSVGLAQRPVIVVCAKLINGVMELNHSSSAAAKRAKRIWDTHFIACALCHGFFSRHRIHDSRFCHECKCHVCCNCDCRVYHLSYQEELWAEDDEKAEAKTKNKKNKNKKKKAAKKKVGPPVKIADDAKNLSEPAKAAAEKSKPDNAGSSSSTKELDASNQSAPPLTADNKNRLASETNEQRSSSRGTIDDDSTSLDAENLGALDEPPENNNEESIDLVSYLQQTGSIIALAKLMDSLYADEELDDEEENVTAEKGPPQQQHINVKGLVSRQ